MEIILSATFKQWFQSMRDRRARARIQARIDRFATGNHGDVKPVRDGLFEMRIDYGPGYRVYYIRQGQLLIVLLNGGDKASQAKDIEKALLLAKDWRGQQ